MNDNQYQTGPYEQPDDRPTQEQEYGYSTTVEISIPTFVGKLPTAQRAYFEIMGLEKDNKVIELKEEGFHIGRSPECQLQLPASNVSRRHARVFHRNEEYHIEDLNSTNGTYVNGVRIVKCVLRNNDHIKIGGVQIIFNEEKKREEK